MASSSTARHNKADPENAFDQIAPSSASTSALNKLPYDVFINHRGIDVKHKLASIIYNTLDCMGLRAFLDVEALQLGDAIPAEIQQAMSTASLHIAIFSPKYAQSPWCLAELSFMLKTGTRIIPIFYHVEPSDLRYIDQGKGVYADVFSEHEKKGRYTQEKLDEWKKVLNTISFFSGYTINDKEDEGRLLKMIVNCVLRVMKRVPLEVAKHPVGLDEFVQEFERATLESAQSHQNVKMAGIVGMGGSGKTTLAKDLFNRKSSSFDRSSFIFDVREAASKNALADKQKKLLSDLDVAHLPFNNVDEGKGVLANRLSSLRVLIILDDVDHIDQLDALLPHTTNLGSDSLVIVTSRELGVLTSWGVSCIYKIPGLNCSHAQQLFCWHAFLQPTPCHGFEIFVEKFLTVCKGLPLSLKVFGGLLYCKKSKEYWESQLNKVSRILPADIKQRLQVSYKALDEEEQQIFLDVACFFIGEEKSLAIAVWDGSGWSGLHSLETLVNKCLVELDEDNCIRMHDHLRDMGREIAASHPPHRIWCPDQILNMKKHSQGRTLIRGINATMNDKFGCHRVGLQNCLEQFVGNSRRGFKRRRFEILHVESNQLTEELAALSEDLVWLRWNIFQRGRNLPSWLSLRNLRVLELYNAGPLENLREDNVDLWEDNVDPPLQLRELRFCVRGSFLNLFPSSIGRLKQLKKIIIKYDFGGSSLPGEFCGLQSLEHLELAQSGRLSSLPADFGNLINLRHINLCFCRQLRMLPDSFKQLIHMEYLNLSGCEMLSSLPDSFGDLINLQHISLSFCKQLTVLPASFKQLIRLEYLNLSSCWKLKLRLDMLENITKLQYLDLQYCRELEELPRQVTNQASLKYLGLSGCKQLKDLPTDIGHLCKLESLDLRLRCPLLTSFPSSLGNLSALKSLLIGSDVCTSFPTTLGNLFCLTNLWIWDCHKLEYLPECIGALNLEMLAIQNSGVKELSFGAGSSSSSEECCHNLTLFLHSNHQLREIRTLPTSVYRLEISACPMLKNIRGIGGLVNLQDLCIDNCPVLNELPSFANLASLKEFRISCCPKVEKIEGLEHLRSLQILGAYTCWEVAGIQSLENVERLKELQLICDTISALKPCVQSMKECPLEMLIRARAVRFANSLEFPDLTVREFEKLPAVKERIRQHLDNAGSLLWYNVEEEANNDEEGKVVHIIVLRQVASSLHKWRFMSRRWNFRKATIVTGEEARVVKAFYQLFALLE